ncbi:MAG: hypothetical protein R3D02_07170 [Hyphomicrobiales bacterium]
MGESAGKSGTIAFEAVVEPARAARFAESLGLPGDTVPLVFPAFWLFEPETQALLGGLVGKDHVPIHVGQVFRYAAPLRQGGRYHVTVAGERTEVRGKENLLVDITVRDADGNEVVEARSTVLLLPVAAGEGQ